MYIVFEWVVGTWKSTQSKLLHAFLQNKYPNKTVELLREPWGTHIAEAIRTLVQWTEFDESMHALTDAYLYAAARAQLLHQKIAPILADGGIVISDRNVCSSLAYQWYTQGLWIDRVWSINKEAVSTLLPDYILFMDLDVEVGLARTFDPEGDKRERKGVDFFTQVYAGYMSLFSFAPLQGLLHKIDASWSVQEVQKTISDLIL